MEHLLVSILERVEQPEPFKLFKRFKVVQCCSTLRFKLVLDFAYKSET